MNSERSCVGLNTVQQSMSCEPQNVTSFGNRVTADIIRSEKVTLESSGPSCNDECPETEVSVWKHRNPRLRDDGSRHWSEAATSQGMSRNDSNQQKQEENHKRELNPDNILILDSWPLEL